MALRILLVEDNEMNQKLTIAMLDSRGYSCDLVVNGEEAVRAVTEKDYDIVFMDCQLPVVDGYESTRQIRRLEGTEKHTPIIAMTAYAMTGDKEKCLNAGMDGYISKPVKFEEVFKLLREMENAHEKA